MMEKSNWKAQIPAIIMILSMFITALVTYPMLPEQLPVHWNIHGEADHYMATNPLSAMLFPLISFFVWGLFLLLPAVDPRRDKYKQFKREYVIIQRVILTFFLLLYGVGTANALGYAIPVGRVIPVAVGLLFIILGNYMGKIRWNYFVGIKLPWTLENETVWNKTHRFGGKLFILGGIGTIAGVIFPPSIQFGVLIGSVVFMVGGTVIYSWTMYKRETHGTTGAPG
jgi:uncharacterized membrane protein